MVNGERSGSDDTLNLLKPSGYCMYRKS